MIDYLTQFILRPNLLEIISGVVFLYDASEMRKSI